MTHLDELERHLSDGLRGLSRLAPDADGWTGIHQRLDRRRRARNRLRVAGVGAVLVAVVAVLVPLAGRGDRPTRVASDPARFPRLVLDLPGFDLVHADSGEDPGPGTDSSQLLVYGDPRPGLLGTGASVFVRLVPDAAHYGIGEGPGTESVDVAGRTGRLLKFTPLSTSLGWYRGDGSIVALVSAGVADDALVDMGREVETALAAGLEVPLQLGADPSGTGQPATTLVQRRSDPPEAGSSSHGEVAYTGPDNATAGLRLVGGGASRLDDLVVDRLASASQWQPVLVGGQPAVVTTYANAPENGMPSRSLMWAVRPGVVAELTARGLSTDEVAAAAASIREVGEAEWDTLLARFRAEPTNGVLPPVASEDTATPYTVVLGELCEASARWLGAGETGDSTVRDDAATAVHAVRDKAKEAGLGVDSDIVLIADRVVAGVDAGDDAAVRGERQACP